MWLARKVSLAFGRQTCHCALWGRSTTVPHCRVYTLEGNMKIIVVLAVVVLCGCGEKVYSPVSEAQGPTIETRAATRAAGAPRARQALPAEDEQSKNQRQRSAPDFKDAAPNLDTSR